LKTDGVSTFTGFSWREEIANGVVHGIGAVLSLAGLVVLIALASSYRDFTYYMSFGVYGFTLIILYSASTLFHITRHARVKRVFEVVDHASIFLLIAGTYTPFLLISMRGAWGWSLLGAIWLLALLGITIKVFFFYRLEKLSTPIYLFMGWIGLIALPQAIAAIPVGGIVWLFAGGFFYTLGLIFYVWYRLPYHHAVWHAFVLAGSLAHYFAVLRYVQPLA
jgi:hemolysin III